MKHGILRGAALVAAFAVSLAGCGGGHAGSTLPATPARGVNPIGAMGSTTFDWGSQIVTNAQYLGPVTNDVAISLNVGLRLQNESGLEAYAVAASDPKSASYRHFLTPEEIGSRFGASSYDYQRTAQYFQSFGLSVGGWPQHLMLAVAGSTAQFSRAFGTTFGWYRLGGQTFVAPLSTPRFASALPVRAVVGLHQFNANKPYIIRLSNGQSFGLSPQQLARAFDYQGAYNAGLTGTGVGVGIIGTGPIDTSGKGDVAALAHFYKAPVAPVVVVPAVAQTAAPVNGNTGTGAYDFYPGGLATPPPVTDTCTQPSPPPGYGFPIAKYTVCNPEDGEAQLDTESVASLAPGSTVNFYLAYNNGTCVDTSGTFHTPSPGGGGCATGSVVYPQEGIQLVDDEIQQAIADNKSDILSLSFGQGETSALNYYFNASGSGPGPAEFAALKAEGIAVFVSSGDTGNQSCFDPSTGMPLGTPCVSYPASDPSVVAVGGVNVPVDNAGALVAQIAAWADQTTLGGDGSFRNNVGSGGGVSRYFTAASAGQSAVTLPSNANPSSSSLGGMRGVPDVALDADPLTGPTMFMNAAYPDINAFPSGGTSAAAPEMAAMWALVLQACKASTTCNVAPYSGHAYRLGDPKAVLYSLLSSSAHGLSYGQVFYDVQFGENQANGAAAGATPAPPITGCCTAGPGYDLVTGLGAPFAGHLIQAFTGTTVP